MQKDNRIIAAILAADVVEYSRLMATDEPGTLAALRARRALFADQVAEFGGREFGSVGDSLMAEFPSAVNAVAAALAIQEAVAAGNAALPPAQRMMLRIGVNLGDVIEEKGGFFGDAVNVAARLQALAKPGGVLISGAVYDQVHAKLEARYLDAGTRQVKNIREPVRSFEVLPAVPAGIGGRIATALSGLASRRILRGVLVGVAVGIALGLGLFWREIPVPATGKNLGAVLGPEAAQAPPNSLAVLPFMNMTGDPENDYLGDGLADEIQHRLSRVRGLTVAARRSAFAFKGKDSDVREIADALGVAYVIEGSIRRQGDRVRVIATLVDRATGANRWSDSYESTGDFFAIEDDIGTKVLAELGRVLGIHPEASPPQSRVGGVAAYDFYLQGLFYLRQPRSAKTLAAAEDLFRRALAEDDDFARAQAGLCQAYVERYALERDPQRVVAAEEACARARDRDPDAQEVHEAIGRLRLATGDAAEAESAYRQALAIVPGSPDAMIGLASALAASDRVEDAERSYKQAIAAQPRYGASHVAYGTFLYSRGRNKEAIAAYEQATILMPDNPDAFSNLGVAHFLSGDFELAGHALERSLEIEPRRGGYTNYGSLQYYLGRYAEAEALFRKALEYAPADNRLWGNLADSLRFGAKPEEARAAYGRALELADGELAINPNHAVNQALAAYYAVQLGEKDRARRGIALALVAGDGDPYVHYYAALISIGLGDEAKAREHVQRARELGYPEAMLKAAPELGDIRKTI
jgi:class 3 adenylate cyclase/TolB-like protein/tetratricopeptide (TPR) repeat protein